MKRSLLLILIVTLCIAPVAMAGVVDSKHDLRAGNTATTNTDIITNLDQVCVVCHTPHQPDNPKIDYDPLWNHTIDTSNTYTVYASSTMNATPTALTGGTTISNMCLSCHDGTVAVGSMYNAPNYGADGNAFTAAYPTLTGYTGTTGVMASSNNAYLGLALDNDHPVNFSYATSAAADGEINAVNATITGLLDASGNVQCSSCHDPHSTTNQPFLVMDNAGSALCTTCHAK